MNYELHPEEDPNYQPALRDELAALLNRNSKENASGTPDYILAEMLLGVLDVYDETTAKRAKWRGENAELPALQRQRVVFENCDACMLADEGRDNGDEDVHTCEESPQTHPDYEDNTPWYLQN